MMRILVDTSVWIDHFRRSNEELMRVLALDGVLTHPMVLLELACGTPPAPRQRTLKDLGLLPHAAAADWREVMAFIERESLYGQGCGLVDLSLLASTLLTPGAVMWTLDRRLNELAMRLGVAHQPAVH